VAGLKLLASYDGITAPLYDIHWEHKQFNKELYELVKSGGELEGKHYWQLEHQLLVNGNDSCIFAVSDGTEENYADLEYHSRPERREQLIEGWKLFLTDLANFSPVEVKPAVAGETIKDLPALVVEIAGEVKSSNLAIYKANALDFIKNINTDLQTDEDFATAENVVKFCDRVERELEVVKKQTLGQASSIDEVVRTIDQLKEEMRKKRLQLEKLVKSEKENRKNEIFNGVRQAFQLHIATCNEALAISGTGVRMPEIPADFVAAGKSKRTIETLRSACNDELARAKIEANRVLNSIDANLELMRKIAGDHKFLFADIQQLVLKDKDALEAIAKQRIAEHEAEKVRRQQEEEALQKAAAAQAQETVAEATAEQPQQIIETVQSQASVTQHEPAQVVTGRASSRVAIGNRASRPGDDRIIQDLAKLYQTNAATVIGWLRSMNLEAAEKRLAA